MENNANYKYYAFISYSHEDSSIAEKIQKKLTEYKLPSVIQKENPLLPTNVRPIFRDVTNLTTGELDGTLKNALERSKFLIVLCSPNSACPNDENKHWVNSEVEHFISLGRLEYIIPVIVDGEPHSKTPENECFCPSLLNLPEGRELLGIDLRKTEDAFKNKEKQKKGIIHIVAKMLGMDIDELWDWYEIDQKKKKNRRRLIIAATAVLVVSLGIGVYFKKFHVSHKYYVTYVDRWGIPEGVTELSKKQILSRNEHYRFDYKDGMLLQVTHANSKGFPIINLHGMYDDACFVARPSYMKLQYGINKELIGYDYYNEQDIKTCEFRIQDDERFELLKINTYVFDYFEQIPIDYEYFIISRDKNGYIYEMESIDSEYKPLRSKNGISKIRYSLLPNGMIQKVEYPEENEMLVGGVKSMEFEYDTDFNIKALSNLDKNGILTFNVSHIKKIKLEYSNGNLVKQSFVDENNNLCTNSNEHVAQAVYEYDEFGNRVSVACYDSDGNRTNNEDGYSKVILEYYPNGYEYTEKFYDKYDNPTLNNSGYHGILTKNNGPNYSSQNSKFNLNGNIINDINNNKAFVEYQYIYDDEYFSYIIRNKSVAAYERGISSGTESTVLSQNRNNKQEIKECYLNKFDSPRSVNGYYSKKSTYKEGHIISSEYFDSYGNPTTDSKGIGYVKYTYSCGVCKSIEYYTSREDWLNDKPLTGNNVTSKVEFEYNEKKELIKGIYYHPDKQTVYYYDNFKNLIMMDYLTNESKQIDYFVYDKRNNRVEEKIYIDDEFLLEHEYTYNDRDLCESEIVTNSKGNVIKKYSVTIKYNDYGQIIEKNEKDTCIKCTYDEKGRVIQTETFRDGINTVWTKLDYNSDDKVTEYSFYMGEGELKSDKIYKEKYKYENGEIVYSAFFLDDKPIKHIGKGSNFHKTLVEKDSLGRQTRVSYYDENDQLVTCLALGYADIRRAYTENNYEQLLLDSSLKPIEGVCRLKTLNLNPLTVVYMEYDKNDNLLRVSFMHYCEYSELEPLNDAFIVNIGKLNGLVSHECELIIPVEYTDIDYDTDTSDNEYYICKKPDGTIDYFDLTGKKITEPEKE